MLLRNLVMMNDISFAQGLKVPNLGETLRSKPFLNNRTPRICSPTTHIVDIYIQII